MNKMSDEHENKPQKCTEFESQSLEMF